MNPEVGLVAPDVVIFMNITPQQAQKRGKYGQEVYETLKTQTSVLKIYDKMRKLYPTWKVCIHTLPMYVHTRVHTSQSFILEDVVVMFRSWMQIKPFYSSRRRSLRLL